MTSTNPNVSIVGGTPEYPANNTHPRSVNVTVRAKTLKQLGDAIRAARLDPVEALRYE